MRSITLAVDGPLHLADFGGHGRLMLLVHGLGGSHANWLSVGPVLAGRHRVLAVDLPGFGLSPAAGRRSTLPQSIRVLHRVVGEVGGRAILVGNSMGGLASLGLAAASSDHVAGLVMVSPALPQPSRTFTLEALARQYLFLYVPAVATWRLRSTISKAGAEAVVRAVLRTCTVDLDRIDPEVLEAHVALEQQRIAHPGWHEPLHDALGSLLRTLAERSTVQRWISRVTVPTLLTHGECDRVVSVRASRAAAGLRPDWTFHEFEGVGHVPQLEAPAALVDVVDQWVERLPSTARVPAAAMSLAG